MAIGLAGMACIPFRYLCPNGKCFIDDNAQCLWLCTLKPRLPAWVMTELTEFISNSTICSRQQNFYFRANFHDAADVLAMNVAASKQSQRMDIIQFHWLWDANPISIFIGNSFSERNIQYSMVSFSPSDEVNCFAMRYYSFDAFTKLNFK